MGVSSQSIILQAEMLQNSEKAQVLHHKAPPQKQEPTQNEQRKDWKIDASPGRAKTIVWNTRLYQFPAMVGTNTSTKKNHNFHNSMVQAISRRGGY